MDIEGIIAGDIHAWAEVAGVADAQAHAPHCATCRCDAPVCDWCDEPVVKFEGRWKHKSGYWGCDKAPWDTYAQVNGSDRP